MLICNVIHSTDQSSDNSANRHIRHTVSEMAFAEIELARDLQKHA
jgi:hypothetical protein